MTTSRSASVSLAALALLAAALLAPPAASQASPPPCPGDPGFGMTITPSVVSIATPFEECFTTPPGDWVLYVIPSLYLGTTPTQFGPLCVAPPFLMVFTLEMPPTGQLCLGERTVLCDPSYVGLVAHFQYVALSLSHPGVFGRSNVATLSIVDGPCDDPPVPDLMLAKTAGVETAEPFEAVTYTYTVTNTGNTVLTDVVVTDDHGTPDFAADDFTVGTIASLEPGEVAVLTAEVFPVVGTSAVVSGSPVTAGAVVVVVPEPGGDLRVTYLQDFAVNDNTYGSGQITWPGKHFFHHLVNSDRLRFRFFDGGGNLVLDFYQDYLSVSSAFPSGYGSLGPAGNDGQMLVGSASQLLSWTSSLADNLNHPANLPFKPALVVSSPTSVVAGNITVDPAKAPGGWDVVNSYTVVVKASAFGAAGFGWVEVSDQHNSPNKLGGPNGMTPTLKGGTVINIATASAPVEGGTLTDTATASVDVVLGGGGCHLSVERYDFDGKTLSIWIENDGPSDALIDAFTLTWPSSNGKLKQIKLGSHVIDDVPDLAPPSASLDAGDFSGSLLKRTIKAGQTGTLKLVFEKNADKTPSKYTHGLLGFSNGCTLVIP